MLDKLDAALRFNREALNLRAERQEVLAANIAHADTPNYKARDFDFSARLSEAVERGRASQSMSLATTSSRHLAGQAQAMPDKDLLYRVPNQSSLDGNTVEMDAERAQFADNTVRYEAALKFLNAQLKTMLAALQS